MKKDYIYRCSKECPINKKCFVIKVSEPIKQFLKIKYKCKAYKTQFRLCLFMCIKMYIRFGTMVTRAKGRKGKIVSRRETKL